MEDDEIYASTIGAASLDQDTDAATAASLVIPDTSDAHTDTESSDAAADTDEVPEEADTAELDGDQAAADETDETTETDADDSFQDLLDPIPTAEQLLKVHTRIPDKTKDALVHLADNWRATDEKLQKIGGEKGIEVLEPLHNLLANPTPTPNDALVVFDTLLKTSPEAMMMGLTETAEVFLTAPQFKPVGDALLQHAFGNGVTTDHIRNLLMLEQGGFVNVEEDMKLLNTEGSDASSLFVKQQEKNQQLQREVEELRDLIDNPDKLAASRGPAQKAETMFESDVDAKIAESVAPYLERGNWKADSAIAKHVLPGIIAGLKNEPEFREAKRLVASQQAYSSDKMPYAIADAMQKLTNKAKARVASAIKEVNADLKNGFGTSRNAIVKEQATKVTPKSQSLKAAAGSHSQGIMGTTMSEEEKIFNETFGRLS